MTGIILCARVSDLPLLELLAPGTATVSCAVCSAPLWVAPTGQQMISQGNEPYCESCYLSGPVAETTRYEIAPGGEEELMATGGEKLADYAKTLLMGLNQELHDEKEGS